MIRSLISGLLAVVLLTTAALGQITPPPSDAPLPSPEPPAPFIPRTARTEQEQDRITAAAHFTRARVQQQRDETAAALRSYQRAWRWDPQASVILSDIIPLAFELKRSEEAARYAVLSAEASPTNPILVRRLALYLTEQREWDRALRLYERSLELQPIGDKVEDLTDAMLMYEMGRLYFLTKQYDQSADAFAKVQEAIERTPSPLDEQSRTLVLGDEPEDAYALWGESYLAAKRFEQAKSLFDKANTAKPDPAQYALRLARLELDRDQVEPALKQLDSYFAATKQDTTVLPYLLLARAINEQQPNKDEARQTLLDRLEKLAAQRPESEPLALYLARQRIENKQYAAAAELLEQTIVRHKTGEAYEPLAKAYRLEGNREQLLKTLSTVAQQTGSLDRIGDELQAIVNDEPLLAELLADAEKVQHSAPDKLAPGQLLAAGLLALEAKQWDVAAQRFDDHLKTSPQQKADLLLQLGLALYIGDENERAIAIFQRMIDEKALPANASAVHYMLAGALEIAGKSDEALAAAREAIKLSPDNPSYTTRLGWVLFHAQRYDEAEKIYRDFLTANDDRYDSSSLRETLRDARLALSNIALEQDDFDAAVEWIEQVLDEYPEDPGALNDLGYLWADRGLHKERALAMTRKAVAADPHSVAYRDSLGWALFQLGRYDEAVEELTRATASGDTDGVILDHLGDALAKSGKTEAAVAAWKRAVTAFQKEAETEKLEQTRKKIASHGKE